MKLQKMSKNNSKNKQQKWSHKFRQNHSDDTHRQAPCQAELNALWNKTTEGAAQVFGVNEEQKRQIEPG